ncbi:MAG: CDF family Co(II)/Ni(II) efflux transporter DmeF [Myxococcales bacterium]|nr:CDF family Co(II)/Ni(II) efflux transporter DmeF [Myxococcales bacterium]
MSVPVAKPWDCRLHEAEVEVRPAERRVLWVVGLTLVTMVAELLVGYWSGSLALVADGWHMASHAGALGLSAGAYWLARARATHRLFVFGTGKVYALAGYTNAVALALVAVWMAIEAFARLRNPEAIAFRDALPVAVIGLVVNVVSAKLLGHPHEEHEEHGAHTHHHEHAEPLHDHDHPADHNLRAAYAHVLADALTSVLAIAGLAAGLWLGWTFLDPLIALLGSAVIMHWAVKLCRSAARQLLDLAPAAGVESRIRDALGAIDDVCITDLHLWEIGPSRFGCVVSIVTQRPRDVGYYRERLLAAVALSHLTVEVHRASPPPATPA